MTRTRRIAPAVLAVGAVLAGTLLIGLSAAAIQDGAAAAADARAEKRGYLRDIMARYDARADESYDRYLTGPRRIEQPNRGRLDPIANKDESRLHSLQNRADRRAFDLAPPVMPHSKNYIGRGGSCLDCHASGFYLGSKYARPISHAPLVNCEQCHIESRHMYLDFYAQDQDNEFKGLQAPQGGVRASSVAPPVMSHGTFMRVNCLACHGPNGYRGMRTTHPERLNCVQCHAVAAEADQSSPYFTGIPRFVLPATPPRTRRQGVVDPATLDQPDP